MSDRIQNNKERKEQEKINKIDEMLQKIISSMSTSENYQGFFIEMIEDIKTGKAEDLDLIDFYTLTKFFISERIESLTINIFINFFIDIVEYFILKNAVFTKEELFKIKEYENYLKGVKLLGYSFNFYSKEFTCINIKECFQPLDKNIEIKVTDLTLSSKLQEFIKLADRYFETHKQIKNRYELGKEEIVIIRNKFKNEMLELVKYYNISAQDEIEKEILLKKIIKYLSNKKINPIED